MAVAKKELVLIAEKLSHAYTQAPESAMMGVSLAIEQMAEALGEINPSFDRLKFFRACDYRQFP